MKKRILLCLLIGIMSLSAAACGDSSSVQSGNTSSSAASRQETKLTSQNSAEENVEVSSETNAADRTADASSQEESVVEAEDIYLSDNSVTLQEGEQHQLLVTFSPDNTTDKTISWAVSDNDILTITPAGIITARCAGTAQVTAATTGGLSASCEVTVIAKEEDTDSQPPESSRGEYKPAPAPTGKTVDAHWFDDAVFVGDSVTAGLYNYSDNGCLGDAEFLAKEYMGFHTAMYEPDNDYSILPVYNGERVRVEDGIAMTGKKKVLIMLGMNDICSWGVDESVDAMKRFVDRILAKNPDVQIYIESVTPMISSKVRPDLLNNTSIALFNDQVKQYCEKEGFIYLDIASVVGDGNGNLRDDLCSDAGSLGHHLTGEGDSLWVEYLKTHVA